MRTILKLVLRLRKKTVTIIKMPISRLCRIIATLRNKFADEPSYKI